MSNRVVIDQNRLRGFGPGGPELIWGVGTPEAAVSANPGSVYYSLNGRVYDKISGSSSTGWAARGIIVEAIATGTVATLPDTTSAILNFGTIDPTIALTSLGRWKVTAAVQLAYAGATIAAQTATFKIRRTSTTAGDLTGAAFTVDLPAATTLTHTLGIFTMPPIIYDATTAADTLELWGVLSAATGAGTVTAEIGGTYIRAEKIDEQFAA